MSLQLDSSTPRVYAPVRRQLFSNIRVGRGTYSSVEENGLLESLPEGLRARILFSETNSSRNSDRSGSQRLQTEFLNNSLHRLRELAGPQTVDVLDPFVIDEMSQSQSQSQSQFSETQSQGTVHDSPVQTVKQNSKLILENLRKELGEHLEQTEWMHCAPRSIAKY
eukprot:TRINITY_DN11334_c0_g3_i2.p3 TRINITY_DN11334_c0_g3~~TRINITY_DN11334_c0_g3_i2.p3  ORF type:complete len:182 (-),score=5.27 TRINITY_DN11334_c0_g3_i2:1399-1896(-)